MVVAGISTERIAGLGVGVSCREQLRGAKPMRRFIPIALGLAVCYGATPVMADAVGLPTTAFVETWTGLSTAEFVLNGFSGHFALAKVRPSPLSDDKMSVSVLADAFASANDVRQRRDLSLDEMSTSWDQAKRTAFQRLRDAEAAYAGDDRMRDDRFVATLGRLVESTGRSAAIKGSASADVGDAYATAIAQTAGPSRAAMEADQAKWRRYGDAFAAFAELQTPGTSATVAAELQRQRADDLAAGRR